MMALTRSSMRQLSFLLEVAPLSGSTLTTRSIARGSAHCLAPHSQRRLQSGKAWKKSNESTITRRATEKPTAQHQLLVDLDREDERARTKAEPGQQASNTQQKNSEGAVLERLDQVLSDAQLPLKRDRIVTQAQALESLRICFDLARAFNEQVEKSLTPAMNLLFNLHELPEGERVQVAKQQISTLQSRALDRIEAAAHNILVDPKVFITQEVLKMYVVFKAYMDRPFDLPEIFELYANKPIPIEGSNPIKFKNTSPGRAAAAIDLEVANAALDAAINVQNLPLCFEIVDKTVKTNAFRNQKFIAQGLIPSVALVATPFAAYGVASQFAIVQEHMTSASAQWVGFAGISSYLLFTGTIGFVALTTANDQMRRVTWADGTPLRERWAREPERAMLDKIVCAWGFRSSTRWSEEEGPEWDALKQLCSVRRMVLDRVELMEGMN